MTMDYIRSDLYRYVGDTKIRSFVKIYIKSATFRFSVAFRLINSKGILKVIGFILWPFRDKKIKIMKSTKIGYGFYIGHGGPVVVNPSAEIGDNCNLSQYVTIGSNEGQAAIIGNNVYIGPSCCLVEKVIIGDNATIGAGSVVTKDIPVNATAAGNYAKVLNFRNPGRYIQNSWKG